jgi:hypothetical protein
MSDDPRPELVRLEIADLPERWEALGFTVADSSVTLGRITIGLGTPGRGITAWTISNAHPAVTEIDGLRTSAAGDPTFPSADPTLPSADPTSQQPEAHHPNGAVAIDHIVVITPDFDRTSVALDTAGMPLRRVRTVGAGAEHFRQGFRRIGPAILELVETPGAPPGPAQFWGLVIIVQSLDVLAERLRAQLGRIKPAVQPGRHIATLKDSAGLAAKVAFMDREPAASAETDG